VVDNIATLGIAWDTTPLLLGTAAINKIPPAATAASSALVSLQSATANVSKTALASAAATDTHTESLRGQHEALRAVATDLAIFSGGLGQAAQVAGALYIENARLVENYGGLGKAIGSLITPTTLLVGGLAAVAVGSVLAYQSIKQSELALGELSERSNTTVTALHNLASAASDKGISSADFTKGMTDFNTLSVEATHSIGSLGELLRVNGAAAATMAQNFSTVADLVKNAANDQDRYRILQAAGLPATREWVQLLSGGSAGIAKATAAAVQFGNDADERLIKRARDFDSAWNQTWTLWENRGKSAAISIFDAVGKVVDQIKAPYDWGTPTGNGGPMMPVPAPTSNPLKLTVTKSTKLPDDQKTAIGLDQQRISVLSNLATVEDQVRQKENEIALARDAGVKITGAEEAAILSYTRAQALGVIAIRQQTDAQNVQAATVGMSLGSAAAYKVVQDDINAAILKGQPLRQDQIAALTKEASALATATQAAALYKAKNDAAFATSQLGRTDTDAAVAAQLRQLYGDDYLSHMNDALAGQLRLNSALTDTKSIASSALSTFVDDLIDGKTRAQAFQDALTGVEKKLVDMASNMLIANMLKSLIGAFGLGGVNPGVDGAPGVVGNNGNFPVPTFPKFASGGAIPGPASTSDSMLARVSSGEFIVNAQATSKHRALLESINSNGMMRAPALPTFAGGGIVKASPATSSGNGGGGGTQVFITNNSGGEVQHKQSNQNGVDVHEIIISAVNSAMANGRLDGAQRSRYGNVPRPVGR